MPSFIKDYEVTEEKDKTSPKLLVKHHIVLPYPTK